MGADPPPDFSIRVQYGRPELKQPEIYVAVLNAMTGVAQLDYKAPLEKTAVVDSQRLGVPVVHLQGFQDGKNYHSVWGLQLLMRQISRDQIFRDMWWYSYKGESQVAYGSITSRVGSEASQPDGSSQRNPTNARLKRADTEMSVSGRDEEGNSTLSAEGKLMVVPADPNALTEPLGASVIFSPTFLPNPQTLDSIAVLVMLINIIAGRAPYTLLQPVPQAVLQGRGFKLYVKPRAPIRHVLSWWVILGMRALGWFLYDANRWADASLIISEHGDDVGYFNIVGDSRGDANALEIGPGTVETL